MLTWLHNIVCVCVCVGGGCGGVCVCVFNNILSIFWLREYCTSYQKLVYFVFFLKIINNFLKNKVCIFKKLFKEFKNGIEILVDQAVFKL